MNDLCPRCNADIEGVKEVDGYYFKCECGRDFFKSWRVIDREAYERDQEMRADEARLDDK